MKKVWNKTVSIIPGFVLSLIIAAVARIIEGLLPIHIIGASVISLFLGMIINSFWRPKWLTAGLKFTSKKILKFAIILLGASLSVNVILSVGKMSLMVMLFTLLTCFGGGYFIGKALGLNWKLSNLISEDEGKAIIGAWLPVTEFTETEVNGVKAWVADPLFADALNYDFTLAENSPAWDIGFEPIDISDVGPRS